MASQLPTLSKIRPPNAGRSPSNQAGTVPRSASPGATGIAVKLPGKSGIPSPGTGLPVRAAAGVSPSTGIPSRSVGISPVTGITSASAGSSPGTGIPSISAGVSPSTGIPSKSVGIPTPTAGVSPSTGIPSKSAGVSPGTGIPSKSAPSGIPGKASGIIPLSSAITAGNLTGSAVSFSISATGIVPDSVSTAHITKSQSSAIPEVSGNPQEPGNSEVSGIPFSIDDIRAPSFYSSISLSQIANDTQSLEAISESIHSKSETEPSSAEAEVEQIESETELDDNESESINPEDSDMADRTVAIGDRVTISGVKFGIVRYFGRVHFAEGYWCGVELGEPDGKHNGMIEGVMYFNVPDNYGIFAPLERVQLAPLPGDVAEVGSNSSRPSGVPKSKLPALKTRLAHETSPGIEVPVPVKSKLPKFSSKSPRPDPDANLRPSKLPGLPKRTPTTPEGDSKIPSLPTKNLNRTFVKEELNSTFTMSNVPDLLTPSPASAAGNVGQPRRPADTIDSDAGERSTTLGLEGEEDCAMETCPLDLLSGRNGRDSMETSVEFAPEARLATSTPLVKRSKSDLDSGLSESEDLAEESPTGNVARVQRPLNQTLTFEENKGRPLSIISTSSIDTGYQPDTDSEMGTLTVNSPSDGEPLHSNGPSDYGHVDSNQQTVGGHSNELQKAYIATFKDYQRGLREGMARDQQRQLAGESDTDMYVSDAPTMLPDSEADKDFSDDDISKDSLAEDIISTEGTDSDGDIDLDSINIPELLTPNSGLHFPSMPSPTTPKNSLPSNGDLTMSTDDASDATTAVSNETVTRAMNGSAVVSTAPSPCDSLESDATVPVAMETSKTESELHHDVSMETVVKEGEGLTEIADLTLVDGSLNETSDHNKILNFTIDLDEPLLGGNVLGPDTSRGSPVVILEEDESAAVRDEGHFAEVSEVRLPSRETSLIRDDGSLAEDTHESTHDDVRTHESVDDDSEAATSPPKINVTLDDVEKIIDATIPLEGDVASAADVTASDVGDVDNNLHATFDGTKTDNLSSQENSLAENHASKESTPTTESSAAPVSKSNVTKKPVVKKIPNLEHKKPNLSKVRSSLADYINTPPPKPKPKPKEPPPPPKKKPESKSPTPEKQIPKVEKVEKEAPKVKRTTPKSKWDSIMTNIKTNKTVPPKPKTEVKSKLFEPTVASTAAQPKVSKVEKLNMKNDAKNLQNRRLSLDSGKSRLAVGGQRKSSLRSGDDLGMSSERSSRTDLRPIGEESIKSDKALNRSASSLRRAGSPSSQSIKSESQLSLSAASQISAQSSRVGKPTGFKGVISDRRTSTGGRAAPNANANAVNAKPPARRTSLVAKKVADAKKTGGDVAKTEPAKKLASKPPVSQIKGHQPDLVSNSIGSRAHAAQEISRLEALCEARTKELTFAKMQIKTASQGFDAMSVIVQYLSHEMNAFQSPELNKRLINAEKKIVGFLADLDELRGEKSRIESTMHDLIQSHKDATEAMRNDHRAQIGSVEERVCKKHEEDLQKVIDQHTEEVKTLKSYHEKRFQELEDRSERQSEDMRKKHSRQLNDLAESDERHLSELQKQHEIKLEEITKRFEEIKCSLHDKVYTLKAECDELRNRSQMFEEALQRDTDFQLQSPTVRGSPFRAAPKGARGTPKRRPSSWSCQVDSASSAYLDCLEALKQFDKELALAPYRDLPQEIDSLRTVVEMRNAEIHELRQSKVELERQLEELPYAREKIISLEQKIENLEAIVTMKQDYEKQLVEKHQHLLRRFDKEFKANKRLSMDNEELMYRLNETEDLLLSPSPERTGVSPVTTPDILARRGFCRSPHDTSGVVTRRQRTSSTSSSDDKRSSTISMRSEEDKGS